MSLGDDLRDTAGGRESASPPTKRPHGGRVAGPRARGLAAPQPEAAPRLQPAPPATSLAAMQTSLSCTFSVCAALHGERITVPPSLATLLWSEKACLAACRPLTGLSARRGGQPAVRGAEQAPGGPGHAASRGEPQWRQGHGGQIDGWANDGLTRTDA